MLALALGVAATAGKADEVVFDLRIERGRAPANMQLIKVKQGDAVKLRWTSDRPIVLHLHGYDHGSTMEERERLLLGRET